MSERDEAEAAVVDAERVSDRDEAEAAVVDAERVSDRDEAEAAVVDAERVSDRDDADVPDVMPGAVEPSGDEPPAVSAETDLETAPDLTGSPEAGEPSLLVRDPQWVDRWDEIQIGFVDDPRQSIENGDALVTEVMDELTALLARECARLKSQWSSEAEPSTEELRVAMQHYRNFLDRLLAA